jgi:hypothetical protein
MNRTPRSRDATAVLSGKGLFVIGVLLVMAGFFMMLYTIEGIVLSVFGVLAAATGLLLMKKPEYIILLVGW